jgi:signal peptidase I
MLSWRMHKARVLTGTALTWAIGSFVVALLMAAVAPLAVGLRTYAVQSGSMTPAIDTGDLVIARTITPTDASVGDIVMFKDPEGTGKLISHRVRAVHEQGGRSYFVTRGDANTGFEHWNVPDAGTIGEIVYRVPKLGFVLGSIGSGPGRIGLVVLPAVLLLGLGLLRIWRPASFRDEPAESQVSGT